MGGFIKEFKEFISKGDVMSMAVGIIIGGAFTAIVNSLVDDLINPLLGLFVNVDFSDLTLQIGGTTFKYGSFIMAIINFLIIAFVLFVIMKSFNKMTDAAKAVTGGKNEEAPAPTEKDCPYCTRKIPIGATRCPECTSELN